MAQVLGKGSVFKVHNGTVLVAVGGCRSISHDGAETETYDGRALDGSAGVPMKPTGFTIGGTYSVEMFWDSEDATQQFITDVLTTPATLACSYTAVGGTEQTFTAGGISLSHSVAMDNANIANVTFTVDGITTYPT